MEKNGIAVAHLPGSKQVFGTDNNIMFLDNGDRIMNPMNMKTPPPPMWGDPVEEDDFDPNEEFYNHEQATVEQRCRPDSCLRP